MRRFNYFIYWRQSFPGRGNVIRDENGRYMTNWWRFVGDWEGSYNSGLGHHGAAWVAA